MPGQTVYSACKRMYKAAKKRVACVYLAFTLRVHRVYLEGCTNYSDLPYVIEKGSITHRQEIQNTPDELYIWLVRGVFSHSFDYR